MAFYLQASFGKKIMSNWVCQSPRWHKGAWGLPESMQY
jgi:hypothetical protein